MRLTFIVSKADTTTALFMLAPVFPSNFVDSHIGPAKQPTRAVFLEKTFLT